MAGRGIIGVAFPVRPWWWLALPLALAGCGEPGGPPLVSAQYPPAVNSTNQPQPLLSLPPGASNPGAAGFTTSDPLTTHPSYGSFTFRPPF